MIDEISIMSFDTGNPQDVIAKVDDANKEMTCSEYNNPI